LSAGLSPRLLRFPEHNEALLKAYRERALNDAMTRLHLFKGLQACDRNACAAFIRQRLKYVRVRRGTVIFSQDELSDDLHIYFIRLGHVRLNIRTPGREERVLRRQPGSLIGEIAQLGIKPQDVKPGEPA
jgi:CRP-like cAMP-binding protein